MYILLWLEVLFIEKIWTQFTEPFLIILPICVTSRCSLGFLRSIKANMDCINFSAHHLLWLFAHKKAVTVSELSDYITRRKKNKNLNMYLNEVQNGCTRSRIRIATKWSLEVLLAILRSWADRTSRIFLGPVLKDLRSVGTIQYWVTTWSSGISPFVTSIHNSFLN